MIDYEAARKLIEQWFPALEQNVGAPVRVLDDRTVEYDYGWMIYWGPVDPSAIPPEKRGRSYLPFLVDRLTGTVVKVSTAGPTAAETRLFSLRAERLAKMPQEQGGGAGGAP